MWRFSDLHVRHINPFDLMIVEVVHLFCEPKKKLWKLVLGSNTSDWRPVGVGEQEIDN